MFNQQKIDIPQRQSNVELLRILAMLGIIIFHHFGKTIFCLFYSLPKGFTESSYFYDVINNSTTSLEFKSLLLDFCYSHFGDGGNLIFMLITGYFLFGKKINFEKRVKQVIKIIFIIVFWGCVLTVITGLVVKFFYPFGGITGFKPKFNFPNWISGQSMWYFQAYCIFILIVVPILKYFEPQIDKKRHMLLIVTLITILFSDYQSYLPNIWLSTRIIQFLLGYYIGGYVKTYGVRFKLKKLIFVLFMYIVFFFLYDYYWRRSMRKMYSPYSYSYVDVANSHIYTLIFAVLVFLIFLSFNFSSPIINHISKSTPGIYVFHYNIISICFAFVDTYFWNHWSLKGFLIFVVIDSIVLFFVGYIIDLVRQFLYSRFQVKVIDKFSDS